MASKDIVNVEEFEKYAKERLPSNAFDYYASGAEAQWTLGENRHAFERIRLRPRILIDVTHVDTSTTILGHRISTPIMVAPTAMQRMAHPDGEIATGRAAREADTAMVLSSWATSNVEEVAAVGPELRIFQLYVRPRRRASRPLLSQFNLPSHLTLKNFEGLDMGSSKMEKTSDSGLASYVAGQIDRSLSWKDVAWLKTITNMPILVKGVLTAEDAKLSLKAGAAGIIVSNHGARQLDYVPATISCLEEVVQAVEGRIPVFLDGGVRRGTDALKALALGATGVFVGRPIVFALATDGQAGVAKLLSILKEEFELAMALAGCTNLSDIKRSLVYTEEDRIRIACRL
eukprot:jgi/Mesen1/2094/ME000151S01357